jgi:hemolysin activation/secretion protein
MSGWYELQQQERQQQQEQEQQQHEQQRQLLLLPDQSAFPQALPAPQPASLASRQLHEALSQQVALQQMLFKSMQVGLHAGLAVCAAAAVGTHLFSACRPARLHAARQ